MRCKTLILNNNRKTGYSFWVPRFYVFADIQSISHHAPGESGEWVKVVPVRIEDGRKGKKMNAREEEDMRFACPGSGWIGILYGLEDREM